MGGGSLWKKIIDEILPEVFFLLLFCLFVFKKTHVVLLIDWEYLLVGHCFELALIVISTAPKYCASDF